MSSGSGDKPPSGTNAPTAPGRAAAETPQRLRARALDTKESAALGASDTAVAVREAQTSLTAAPAPITTVETPLAGTPAVSELVGVTLSERYLVKRKIGQGGMGAVYEATHTQIGGRYAVKVLLEKYAQREAIVARLKQEAQLATSLDNEHIIRVTDFGNTEDGRTFVVMEYLDGESLAELLARESKLGEQRILHLASQTASALAAAHAKGIVHRDIKPENVFLLRRKDQDFVKVVDFGISKSLRSSDEQEEVPRLTQTGMVLGTPLYMSPEQARGDEDLDHRVDIYALGVIMYEAASGRVPFVGNNYLSVISQVLNEEPKPLRVLRPELSEEFEAIVMRAMAKDRTQRYANATAMLADVNAVLDDPTRSTERAKITGPRRLVPRARIPRAAWAVGGIGIAIAGVTIAVFLMNGGSPKKPVKAAAADPPKIAPADAAPAAPPPDAAPVRPEAETIVVHVESNPAGAQVFGEDDGRAYGATPCDVALVVHDDNYKLIAQLPGYDDRHFAVNPLAQKAKNDPVVIRLVKAVGRAPKTTKMTRPGAGSGSAAPTGHGELTGNPFGGNVPR
ncbi:MAG TPA: serine/threonine-protein kinase [Kofleriaceae bacterium]|nr:serine/threonine-protein kinase [Kofleriaceae bacterium]